MNGFRLNPGEMPMPLYEYYCDNCEYLFETEVKMADRLKPTTQPCPSCEKSDKITQYIGISHIGDPVSLGIKRVPNGFNEVLRNIQREHPTGHVNIRD